MSEPTYDLPIFPLSAVVLFPRVRVPLYIFEERYRAMARDVLDGEHRIGMVTVRPGEDTRGDPPLFGVGCEGLIQQSRQNPDGTYHLVLLGTRRFRIVDEPTRPTSRLYRVASVEPLDESGPDAATESRISGLRGELVARLESLVRRAHPEGDPPALSPALDALDAETFVNTLSQAIDFGTVEKQGLLESPDIEARYRRLLDLLAFRAAEIGGAEGGDPEVLH